VDKLSQSGAHFTIHEHVDSRTFADALEKLSFPQERLLKTVAFRLKSGGVVLVALRGEDRVDYRNLAAAFGVKRDQVNRLTPEEVLQTLGVEAGSVGPLTTIENVQVIIDSNVSRSETLFCGIGRPDRTLEIRLDDLLRVTHGRIEAVAQLAQ
jgi:Cys-tRNA(Pro)/Cys-tRNA(Cys) deacylase